MTVEPSTRILKADPDAIAALPRAASRPAGSSRSRPRRSTGSAPTRPTARPCAALRGQGPARFNPLIAHVPDIAAAHALAHFDDAAERLAAGVLARAADAGAAEGAPIVRSPTCDRRARHHRVARARASGCARAPRAPSAARWPRRPPTARAMSRRPTPQHVLGRSRRPHRSDRRRRRHAVGLEFDHRACRRAAALLRPGGVAARGDRSASAVRWLDGHARPTATRRWRPACSLPLRAARADCGSTRRSVRPAKLCSPSGRLRRRRRATRCSISRQRGDLIEAAANLFSYLRALDASAPKPSRSCRSRMRASARRSTTGLRAPPRRDFVRMHMNVHDRKPHLAPTCSPASPPSSATATPSPIRRRIAPYLIELRGLYHGRTPLVLRPGSVEEVSRDPEARQRDRHADRAAGRQYRARRRADAASTARSCCRSAGWTASARSIRRRTP